MNLDDLHVQVHLGATPRPAPAYPCTHSCIFGAYGSDNVALKKKGHVLGPPHGRPTMGQLPSIRGGAPASWAPSSSQLHQSHAKFFFPLLSLLLFLSKFIRKRRKTFPSFAFSFASHMHFVFTFFSLQRVCGGTTTPQERFCGTSSPTRTILWSVITHKNDFCERQPCPARTNNSRTANFGFH